MDTEVYRKSRGRLNKLMKGQSIDCSKYKPHSFYEILDCLRTGALVLALIHTFLDNCCCH